MAIFKTGVTVTKDTEKALLCEVKGEKDFWVPKSQIDSSSPVFDNFEGARGPGKLVMSDWWSEKFDWAGKGWVKVQ